MSGEDKRWMRRCQRLARLAARRGNAAVGAVVVRAGRLIAQGQECVSSERNVAGHAELEAIQQSCRILGSLDLSGCTLYTTTEPCWMCAFGIRETGIVRVVIGRAVADIGGVSSKYPLLVDAAVGGWSLPPRIDWLFEPFADE